MALDRACIVKRKFTQCVVLLLNRYVLQTPEFVYVFVVVIFPSRNCIENGVKTMETATVDFRTLPDIRDEKRSPGWLDSEVV